MTTLFALFPALVFGFSALIPLSPAAHQLLVFQTLTKGFDWPALPPFYVGFLTLTSLLALLLHYRHDFVAMTASVLRILVTRKKPMTLDERLPLFMLVTLVPGGIAAWYLGSINPSGFESTLASCAWFTGLGAALWLADLYGKKSKNIFDWNLRDAALMALGLLVLAVPGGDWVTGGLLMAALLGHRRVSSAKYVGWLLIPVLAAQAFGLLHGQDFKQEIAAIGILPFVVGSLTCFAVSLVTLRAFIQSIENRGFFGLAIYRGTVAAACLAMAWFRGLG